MGYSVGDSHGLYKGSKYGIFYGGVGVKVNISVIWVIKFNNLKDIYISIFLVRF